MLELLQAVASQSERWWEHILETFIGGGVPAILWMMDNRRRARKQAAEEQEKTRTELEKKHRENTSRLDHQDEKLDEIIGERKYLPAHGHRETSGPLTAEGMHWPPKR